MPAFAFLEQMTGIEPAYSAWEADTLPLSYICVSIGKHYNTILRKSQYLFCIFSSPFFPKKIQKRLENSADPCYNEDKAPSPFGGAKTRGTFPDNAKEVIP